MILVAAHGDGALVGVDDGLGDGQPEAAARDHPLGDGFGPEEPFEDPLPVDSRNADAGVRHAQHRLVSLDGQGDLDLLVGPELWSAVFKVLAATPGVQVNSHAHDSLGRPAVKISWFDRVTSVTLATFEAPATTRILEQTDTSTPASANGHSSYTGRDLYLSITRSRSVPSNPYAG